MKTVGIIGSPRKGGNCDILVNTLADKIDGEKDIYFLDDLDINFCKACRKCQDGDCVRNDDLNKIIDNILNADVLIFSSPIYYGQISAQAKTFIDRFYQVSSNPNKTLEGTKFIQIFTQGSPADTYADYIESMKNGSFAHLGMEHAGTIVSKGNMGMGVEEELKPAIDQMDEIVNNL